MRSEAVILAATLVMAPLGAKAVDLVVWCSKGYCAEERPRSRGNRRALLLFLVLASFAVALEGAIVSARAEPSPCECQHRKKIKKEVADAEYLQKQYEQLRQKYRRLFNELEAKYERSGQLATFQDYASSVRQREADRMHADYAQDVGALANAFRQDRGFETTTAVRFEIDICRPEEAAMKKAIGAAACRGIGRALEAHEAVHAEDICPAGRPRPNLWPRALAETEVGAYTAQIAVLRQELADLKCDDYKYIGYGSPVGAPSEHFSDPPMRCGSPDGEWQVYYMLKAPDNTLYHSEEHRIIIYQDDNTGSSRGEYDVKISRTEPYPCTSRERGLLVYSPATSSPDEVLSMEMVQRSFTHNCVSAYLTPTKLFPAHLFEIGEFCERDLPE